jgi:hypothetical protein
MSDLDFTFDAEAAEQGDNFTTRLDTTGRYVGKFTAARRIVARTGTSGVALTFEAKEGGLADLNLYATKPDGTRTFGYNQLQAVMGLLGLKTGLQGVPGKAQVFDAELGQRVEQDVTTYPALCGKDVGVVLRKRLYSKDDGSDGWSVELAAVFDAVTGATWTEKKAGAMPVKIGKLLATIKDKDDRKAGAAPEAGASDLVGGF